MGVMWWRRLAPVLLAGVAVLGPPMLRATPAPGEAPVGAADGVALTVADAGRLAEFYERVLFFERIADRSGSGRVVRLRLGGEILELREARPAGTSRQPVAIVVNDLDQAYLWLRRHRVQIASPAPSADWDPRTGGVRTVHFSDPEGHPLALVHFSADAGAARWQRPTDRVFLGIEHLAGGGS